MRVIVSITPEKNDGAKELASAVLLIAEARAAGHTAVLDRDSVVASALAERELDRSLSGVGHA